MKVTAEHGENREVTLTIEVEQAKLEKATDGAAKRIAGRGKDNSRFKSATPSACKRVRISFLRRTTSPIV